MRRWAGLGIGAAAVAAAGLVAGSSAVRAGQEEPDRRVEVFRFTGPGARLGVVLADVSAADVSGLKLAEERGAVVKNVSEGSAAEKAGFQEDDVVLSYQGEKVWSAAQLRRLVRETPAGRRVAVEVSRGGAPQRLTATLEAGGERELALGDHSFRFEVPTPAVPPIPPMPPMFDEAVPGRRSMFRDRLFDLRPGRLGLMYQELSGQLARYFKVDDGSLLVTEVEADGPAGKAGVRAGDVIVKVDGKTVTDVGLLRRAIREAPAAGEVTLTVQRDGRPLDLKVALRDEGRARPPRTAI